MSRAERLRWRIVNLADRIPGQCWADLVSWVLGWDRDGWRGILPWRPIGQACRKDADAAGRCYCGRLGSDGVLLRRGETVCVTRMPGSEATRLCSRPDGHDGPHRCGGLEWGSA